MARLGIDATLSFQTYNDGQLSETVIEGTGVKDITCEVSASEVTVESRGYKFKRYLAGQKDLPIDFQVEADSDCADTLRTAFWDGSDIYVTFTDAGGQQVKGCFIVTKFGVSSPIAGEEEYSVSIRPSANSNADEPTHAVAQQTSST